MKAPADLRENVWIARRSAHDRIIPSRIASFRSALRAAQSGLKQSFVDGTIFFALIAVAVWALTHPYQGIFNDAKVYIGRALADLDPAGVGRDMMFVHDEQSRFSLFPLLTDRLVAALGTNAAALLLAVLSMAVWITALCCLARQFVAARFVFIVVIFVALLPDAYGYPARFHYSEIIAVPRPFAEALVLAAIAVLAVGRDKLTFLLLIVASAIHPIMTLAGWGVFALVLCCEDRRWRVVAALAVVLALAGALLGVPILDRLFTFMDPDLQAFAEYRSPHLFPSKWPVESFGPVLAQTATLLIAASFFDGRRRLILLATIAVGVGGIAVQALLGDYFSLLLIIQAQPWRMAWLLAALGTVALATAALELWQKGPRGHIVLALLALAWLCSGQSLSTAMICAVALIIHFRLQLISLPMTWTMARATWICAFVLALCYNVRYFIGYASFIAAIPPQGPGALSYLWNDRYFAFPILALILIRVFQPKPWRLAWAAECGVALLLAAGTAYLWDTRPPIQRILDSNTHPPELMQLIASRGGEVLWVDGLVEAWFLTGRPQWASPQQGVSMIFSRDLARQWRARMQFLVDHGLAEKKALQATHVPAASDLPQLPREGIAQLCVRADAPAWIIAPVTENMIIPSELKPTYWRPQAPNFEVTEGAATYVWHPISAYAVLPCARG